MASRLDVLEERLNFLEDQVDDLIEAEADAQEEEDSVVEDSVFEDLFDVSDFASDVCGCDACDESDEEDVEGDEVGDLEDLEERVAILEDENRYLQEEVESLRRLIEKSERKR